MTDADREADAGTALAAGIACDSKRQADLYWRQIEQLKGAAVCMRLYRNRLARQVTLVGVVKAAASSGAIAAWFASGSCKLLRGCIIAAAQVLDVLKDTFPFAKQHRQAASLTPPVSLWRSNSC